MKVLTTQNNSNRKDQGSGSCLHEAMTHVLPNALENVSTTSYECVLCEKRVQTKVVFKIRAHPRPTGAWAAGCP